MAFGNATIANYHGLFGPVYRIGQGATDGPPWWTCIADKDNSVMFVDDMLHHHNNQDKAIAPWQQVIK
eukprot:12225844-Ditylum_brightwellii.AAC.1